MFYLTIVLASVSEYYVQKNIKVYLHLLQEIYYWKYHGWVHIIHLDLDVCILYTWMCAYYIPGCVHIIHLDVCILYTWMCAYYTPGCVHIIYLDVYILYTWKCAYYTPGCVHINTPGCVHIIHLDVYILYTWMCAYYTWVITMFLLSYYQ